MSPASLFDLSLHLLGIRNFLIGVHDPAFPSLAAEDLGRGSPYSEGAASFLQFARDLGFNGVQLGPQGITTPANASPYDGSYFSRNPLSLAPLALLQAECPLLDQELLASLIDQRTGDPQRVDDRFARWAQKQIAGQLCTAFRQKSAARSRSPIAALGETYRGYRQKNGHWLERDSLYQLLRHHYGERTWKDWGKSAQAVLDRALFAPAKGREGHAELRMATLRQQHIEALDDYCFLQFLLAEQHRRLQEFCRRLGLRLFGDYQIGMSGRDAWYAQSFLLPGYVMGAPPSRTNPQGQPWNYPVLDPRQYYTAGVDGRTVPGPAMRFVLERLEKMAEEFDGLRLDHPHGLICPWVYKQNQQDPFEAVQNGGRLFASPALPDHPDLAGYAIVRPDQLDSRVARYDDHWVTNLDAEQLNRYGQLFAVIMDTLDRRGSGQIACEILSTQPYPVQRVLELYGLGRLRVTQKADLANHADVYRGENAQPEDWLMLGNHDTAPIWQVAERWAAEGTALRQAEYLAGRLAIPEAERAAWIERRGKDTAALVQAKFAELFVGPARNIMVFFTDLLGVKEPYNRPGIISGDNWSQRIPIDYALRYRELKATGHALDIPAALALALRARINSGVGDAQQLREAVVQLEEIREAP